MTNLTQVPLPLDSPTPPPRWVVTVVVPVPVNAMFDYLSPTAVAPGCRVMVPFGSRQLLGLVVEVSVRPVDATKLKPLIAIVDVSPLLSPSTLTLMHWAIRYYAAPPGEMLALLPKLLRTERKLAPRTQPAWSLTPGADGAAGRGHRQQQLLATLALATRPMNGEELTALLGAGWRRCVPPLVNRGILMQTDQAAMPPVPAEVQAITPETQQLAAVSAITADLTTFSVFLLEGVTGSGKTEVYILAARVALLRRLQVLVLVPEIALTPQTVARFRAALPTPVVVLHSGLSDRERLENWLLAKCGLAGVVIGTRSAVFAELPRLGLVIVDEEHDASFKQDAAGMRYSARDTVLMRAKLAGIPVVLGSATPSLESLNHALSGRYHHLRLTERAQGARLPRVQLIDLNREPRLEDGLSATLIAAMRERLERDEQVVIFINRRGFAPVVVCQDCGWSSGCPHCDARMVWHKRQAELRCHYCGHHQRHPGTCPACQSPSGLRPAGEGTQRVEERLRDLFPDYPLLRMDRDAIRGRAALEQAVAEVRDQRARILVGTQMVAKGHDFHGVTLVGVLDIDGQLFSADFRAVERLGQTLTQVAGRAGRGVKSGLVMIQTRFPGHHALRAVCQGEDGYRHLATTELLQRKASGFPPFGFLAVATARSRQPGAALAFLEQARHHLAAPTGVELHGPMPPTMERLGGEYRAHLIAIAPERTPLRHFVATWSGVLAAQRPPLHLHWAIDVDPLTIN